MPPSKHHHPTRSARLMPPSRPTRPSQKRTKDNELHPFKDIIVKTNLAQVSYDPLLYPGTGNCAEWCGGEIRIDMDASEVRHRRHFPDHDVADWPEKCSWDGLCSGCPECKIENNQGITCVAFCEILTSDSLTAPWKTATLSWNTTCAWGPCHGCDECSVTAVEEQKRVKSTCTRLATEVRGASLSLELSEKAAEIAYEAACASAVTGASLQQAVVVYAAAAAAANAGELAGFNDADMAASGHAAGAATWASWRELQIKPEGLKVALAGGKSAFEHALRGMPTENAINGGHTAAIAVADGHTPEEAKAMGIQAATKPTAHAPALADSARPTPSMPPSPPVHPNYFAPNFPPPASGAGRRPSGAGPPRGE